MYGGFDLDNPRRDAGCGGMVGKGESLLSQNVVGLMTDTFKPAV